MDMQQHSIAPLENKRFWQVSNRFTFISVDLQESVGSCIGVWSRVARAVVASGRPSQTGFQLLASSDCDFSAEALPGLLGPSLPSPLTRCAPMT